MRDLRFVWEDDEVCHVSLDDDPVIVMDHGPHGWDGMEGIRDALLAVARLEGWVVTTVGTPGV